MVDIGGSVIGESHSSIERKVRVSSDILEFRGCWTLAIRGLAIRAS